MLISSTKLIRVWSHLYIISDSDCLTDLGCWPMRPAPKLFLGDSMTLSTQPPIVGGIWATCVTHCRHEVDKIRETKVEV
jgi:hypothetical protein